MGKPSKQLMEFMERYKIDSDEVWEIPSSSAWAVKHAALERVAAEQGITFAEPQIATRDYRGEGVALLVIGKLNDKTEWSFGEASTLNLEQRTSRNGKALPVYPWAFAEKRAKDRVILKLLNTHGSLYSESEADEFTQRPNPHVTRPEDIVPAVEYDEHGQPVDNIPHGDERIVTMPKAKAKGEYSVLQSEMLKITSVETLQKWGVANANRIATLPQDWQAILRGQYSEHLTELRTGEAA